MNTTVQDKITTIISNILLGGGVDTNNTFKDHGFDSLDLTNTILETEVAFDVCIDPEDNNITLDMPIKDYISYVDKLNTETNGENA